MTIPTQSGLSDAVSRLKHTRKIGIVEFTVEDVVRSGIVKDIIKAYFELIDVQLRVLR
ncbi:MAG: PhoH family protein [Methylococcaceae bacterium]|jgi:phosphate starvation-inducible protein PhoH|nr:PhoH family protein [Methylococcaceae bacterium]